MYRYVTNKFVSIRKTGLDRYYIKHGVLSKKSYILSFEDESDCRSELMDRIIKHRGLEPQDLPLESSAAEAAGELVEFLLGESILVPEYTQELEQYYAAITAYGRRSSLDKQKVWFIASTDAVKSQLKQGIKGVNVPHSFVDVQALDTLRPEQCSLVCAVYDHFAPDVFHRINQACIAAAVPLQISYLDGSTTYISPVMIKGETVCYNEFEVQLESSLKYQPEYLVHKASAQGVAEIPPFLLNLVLFYALHLSFDFLIRGKLKTKNRAFIFDLESLRYDLVDVLPLPNCPACKGRDKMVHDFL